MARAAFEFLSDVLEAIAKIREYTAGGEAAFRRNSMARDAVIARLIQIGQAVKDAQAKGLDLPALDPGVRWRDVAGMRDRLAHRYWDADLDMIWKVVASDLEALARAVRGVRARHRKAAGSAARRRKDKRR